MSADLFARYFAVCDSHDFAHFVPFMVDGNAVGMVKLAMAKMLLTEIPGIVKTKDGVGFAPEANNYDIRSKILHVATSWICEAAGKKLRNEAYAVVENWGDEPLAQIDRAGIPSFGFHAFGIHVNGFVRKPDGIYLWVGERAADRLADPGKFDNMIGGGQPLGLTLEENLHKEGFEEAGLSPAMMNTAKLVREISYRREMGEGLRNDTLFIYDLELPADIKPRNTDGEVAAFHLLPLHEVERIIDTDADKFKWNCNLVIADFIARQTASR